MNTTKLFQRALAGTCMLAVLQLLSPMAVEKACAQIETTFVSANSKPGVVLKRSPAKNIDRVTTTSPQIKHDKTTSFYVRGDDSKRIQLLMSVDYSEKFTQMVRALVRQQVTPLVFSVSALPNRPATFDPTLLCFKQNGHVWQPQVTGNAADILPVKEGAQFGGIILESLIQQGAIILPAYFDPQLPMTVRYGKFHYLACFAPARL